MEFVNKTATILILLLLGASVGERYKTFVWLLALGVIGLVHCTPHERTDAQAITMVVCEALCIVGSYVGVFKQLN